MWAAYTDQSSFSAENRWRVEQDLHAGWVISYKREADVFWSWSGRKGARISYQRAIPVCDGASVYFRLEYNEKHAAAFEPVVRNLVKTLSAAECE
ncbi:hypothetical protein GCM10016234_18810 [Tianweitania populi]|uniref:Uncharacterized protein n=1 Tax=Tianweitania populi TaxID=1607949 RepID=A0A8J3DVA4_9HYPH|nr:hypothetical protein GCM10016234_18810 [Tianweitania populi]